MIGRVSLISRPPYVPRPPAGTAYRRQPKATPMFATVNAKISQ
jgi:hypothetical protein